MPLPLPTWLFPSRSDHCEGSVGPSQDPGGGRPRRRRAVASALFAIAFAAVDAVSQVVGRVQPATRTLAQGALTPARLLAALVLSGAVCWGFLALVDLAARRRARRSQSTDERPGDGRSGRRRLALTAFLVRAPVADGLDERHGLDPAQPDRCRGTAPHHLHPDDRRPVPSGATGRRRSGRRRAAVGGTDAAVGHMRKCRHGLSRPQGHLTPHDRGLHRLLRAHAAGGRLLLRRGQGRGLLPLRHPAHPGAAGGAFQCWEGAAEPTRHGGGRGGPGGFRAHA